MARFVESWSATIDRAPAMPMIIKDIHDRLSPDDQVYFRASREKRFGRTLEELQADREERVDAWRAALGAAARDARRSAVHRRRRAALCRLHPLRRAAMGAGHEPVPAASGDDDPVKVWFERCLDLFGGMGRAMPAAA